MAQALPDRLMELCKSHAPQIAEQWYQSLSENPRTQGYKVVPKAVCLGHAVALYEKLHDLFFAKNCAEAVAQYMDEVGFVEDRFNRGVPLEEVIYALVLLRRQIWLYADSQAIYGDISDMYQATYSINRILLVFDYITYSVAKRYRELAQEKAVKSGK